jgi:DNA-directed RNA polymerase subunit RPC12/RpoP
MRERRAAEKADETPADTGPDTGFGACWNCGSKNIEKTIATKDTANKTKSRYVGGRHVTLKYVCQNCETEQ